MIRTFKIAFLILGSVVLQIALISRISMFGSQPDLPLALIVSMALFKGPFHGEVVGFISGLLLDFLSDGPLLGVQALSRTIIGYGIGFIRGKLYSDNFITQLVSGFVATLVHKGITLIHLSLLFTDTQFLQIRLSGLLLAAISNSILVAAIFRILKTFARTES